MSTQSFTRFSRFSRLFWIASATFSSALPRKWHSLQTWVEVRQQGGDIKQSSRKNIKCEYHGITNCNIISIYLSIYRSIYLSIRPSIYLFILRTWFFTGSQSPKSQMQVEGPCFPSSAAQRSWNSAQQQNSDASGWQLQQGMYCWPQQWKDRPRSYGTKLLSTTHLRKGCLSLKWLWRRACSSPEWKLVIT